MLLIYSLFALAPLQGDWVLTTIEENGKKIEVPSDARGVLSIKGVKWEFAITGEKGEIAALHVNYTPHLIDLKAKRRNGTTFVREGIYKLEGDTLTICHYKGEDKKRPTRFDPPKEETYTLLTLKKEKKDTTDK